jgi:hypothetical protein
MICRESSREDEEDGARMIVLVLVDGDPMIREFALRPLIITTVDRRGRIRWVLHIEKHEAVCDLCGGLTALTKKELMWKTRGYAVIVDGRVAQVISEAYEGRFWKWAYEKLD